jgi:hypothetical protein
MEKGDRRSDQEHPQRWRYALLNPILEKLAREGRIRIYDEMITLL